MSKLNCGADAVPVAKGGLALSVDTVVTPAPEVGSEPIRALRRSGFAAANLVLSGRTTSRTIG